MSAVIYVDSVNGSDSASGLNAGAAFQTLAKAQSAALASGSGATVNLARGSFWRDALDLRTLDQVSVRAYGNGSLPIIAGDNAVTPASWTLASGQAHTYQCSWAAEGAPGNHYVTVWDNNIRMTWASSIATCDSVAGSFFFDYSNNILYVHPIDGTNPAVNGHVYEAVWRLICLYLNDDCTVSGVITRRQGNANGSCLARYRGLFDGCQFLDGTKHNALMASGEYRNCYAGGIEPGPSSGGRTASYMMEFFGANLTGQTAAYTRCVFVGPGGGDTTHSGEVQAMGGHSDGTAHASITCTDCAVTSMGTAFGYGGGNPITVTRLRVDNCAVGVENDGAPISVTDSYFTNVRGHFVGSAGTTNVVGHRAVLGASHVVAQTGGTWTLNLDRSAVYCTSADGSTRIILNGGSASGSTANVTRTAVASVAGSVWYLYDGSYNNNLAFLGNHNAYFPNAYNLLVGSASAPGFKGYGSVSSYFADIQPGNENASIVADPQFANPAANDWTVGNAAVTAIGAGCERPRVQYTPLPAPLLLTTITVSASRPFGF